ncbi:YIP1 family protein [Alkalihalobacillus trypoxylicola]|uniref:YIP1 family protein n=1 Tax=Alkalihalobacillus trypoxylicola TaxID=519424 RepID=UPI000AC7C043
MWFAFMILFLLAIVMILKRQYTGFIVNFNNLNELNSLAEFQYLIIPFFLWCVANWSITTLMDGEGKFKEIILATAYAFIPMLIIYAVTILISQFITQEEAPLYFLLDSFASIWFLGLLFVGIMTVHQYSVTKTIVTFFLTVCVMGLAVFLGLLLFSLFQQMWTFIETIYREMVYRT